jgi:hypothetical protein
MVPLFDSTCRNLGVLANAQTRSVQSDVQSGRYSAPISNAWERNVPLSGFTNPESTKTTPSKSLEKSDPFCTFSWVAMCFFLPGFSSPSFEPIQEGRFLLDDFPLPLLGSELDSGILTTNLTKNSLFRTIQHGRNSG